MSRDDFTSLEKIARKARRLIVEMIFQAKSGHIGGSLSIVDILTYLYAKEMNIKPEFPNYPDRDRLVLSKGHASSSLYAILALRNFFDEKELKNFRQIGSFLQGHPDKLKVPGVDVSTGSLGQGASVAVGIALSAKIDRKNFNVYTIVGDGEMQEGQIWESMMFSSHYALDNLVYIIDNNGLQIDGKIKDIMNIYPLSEKFLAFGFNVMEIDAHNFLEIKNAINSFKETRNKPTAIIANSVKGRGISFMENNPNWHGVAPNEEEYEKAMEELLF